MSVSGMEKISCSCFVRIFFFLFLPWHDPYPSPKSHTEESKCQNSTGSLSKNKKNQRELRKMRNKNKNKKTTPSIKNNKKRSTNPTKKDNERKAQKKEEVFTILIRFKELLFLIMSCLELPAHARRRGGW